MIARIWRGETPAAKREQYIAFLHESGIRDYRATPGNRGVFMLTRTRGDVTEFVLLTLWESREAIARFAGPDIDKAHYYPEDKDFLLSFPPTVDHFECELADVAGMLRV